MEALSLTHITYTRDTFNFKKCSKQIVSPAYGIKGGFICTSTANLYRYKHISQPSLFRLHCHYASRPPLEAEID